MRLLYWEPKTYNTLKNEVDIGDRPLVNALGTLRNYYDISAKEIILNKRKNTEYSLTKNGKDKLAFYEGRYRFHEFWCPPLEKGIWHKNYIHEIAGYLKQKYY